jgi:hypothetical protein
MFNFFFREEREKLMAERVAGTGALVEAEQRGIDEGKDANTRKKELFALVGKIIAERWKHVTPQELERLKGLADEDMVRFNDEMSEYQINVARKKRVKDEATASTAAGAAASAAVATLAGGRGYPMHPGEPTLSLFRPAGSPLASFTAASSSLQRPGLSVDDQLQRDPSLRLPTPIEDLLRARRRAVLGDYQPTSPNTAPSRSLQLPRHLGQPHPDLASASPVTSSGMLSPGSFRRTGDGLAAESMVSSALLGARAGAGGGSAYETQQQLLMQLLQQDRPRLFAGSSAIDQLSSLGRYPMGSSLPTQQQHHQALQQQQQQQQQQHHQVLQQQQQQQQQQLQLWPEAQSSRMASSADVLRSELQRQERDMIALLRQQQQQHFGAASSATGLASLSDASLQQKLSYQELLQMQQHQQQQQQLLQLQRLQQQQLEQQQQQEHQQQEHLHQHLRRARRDSDSDGEPDPYP